MIRIAVCDDDISIAKSIHRYLERKSKQIQDEKLDVFFYQSGVDFLHDVELGETFHIVFMDIEMEGISGVEVGQILRNRIDGDDVIMIYISSHDSYYKGLVDIGSFRFIEKPIDESKLDHAFSKALHQAIKYKSIENKPRLFSFKVGTEDRSVRIDEIAYLKNNKRVIDVYIWDNVQKAIYQMDYFYSKMDDVMEKLPQVQFIRCERSHIVNLDYVCRISYEYLTLMDRNATRIPIGRAHRDKVKVAYFKHRSGQYF